MAERLPPLDLVVSSRARWRDHSLSASTRYQSVSFRITMYSGRERVSPDLHGLTRRIVFSCSEAKLLKSS